MEFSRRILSVRSWIFSPISRIFTRKSRPTLSLRQYTKSAGKYSKFGVLSVAAVFPVVNAGWGFGSSKKPDETSKDSPQDGDSETANLIKTADDLYTRNEVVLLYDMLLAHKDCNDDDILWRLARASSDKAKLCEKKEDEKALHYEGFGYAKRALEINENNFAVQKWYAILLDKTGGHEGTKQRISNAFHVKEHFMKAIELNPSDATSIHSLGYWCFLFADLAWYERKVASVIFTSPPNSSYEEALKYFLDAEKTDPNFYSMNLLMIGKTYSRMKDNKQAILYLTRAKDFHVVTEDDKKAHKEAVELLKGLGIKDAH